MVMQPFEIVRRVDGKVESGNRGEEDGHILIFKERKKRGRERGWYSGERRGRMRKKRSEISSVLIVNA